VQCQDLTWSTLHTHHAGPVTLRLKTENTCEFLRTETKLVESNTYSQTDVVRGGNRTIITDKVKHKVTTHYWSFGSSYQLTLFHENKVNEGFVIKAEAGHVEIGTSTKIAPHPTRTVNPSTDLHLNWLLDNLDGKCTLCVCGVCECVWRSVPL
jgi:hypothetical protein